jgi:hypothetical protein
VIAAHNGMLRTRPMDRPVYEPSRRERVARPPLRGQPSTLLQLPLTGGGS